MLVTEQRPAATDLLARLPDPGGFAWVRRGDGLVGWGEAARIDPGVGPGRFEQAAEALEGWFAAHGVNDPLGGVATGGVAFAAFTFAADRPGSAVVVPEVLRGLHAGRGWVTRPAGAAAPSDALEPLPAPQRVRYAGSSLDEVAWLEAVATATRRIRGGSLRKVVLARDLQVWAPEPLDTRVLARRLAAVFPDCYTFVHDGLVGATPELLVRRRGWEVSSLVLAGSARRGTDEQQDAALGAALLASAKDRDEHALSVASVVGGLEPVCAALEVDPEPWLLRLDNVQHLATRVTGRLAAPLHVLRLAGRLHPTAAVCGTPTAAARAALTELERLDRARYAGPVGWADARGDGEVGIALRCAEVDGARARLFAGAGIVADSLPEAELEETRIKLLAMQSALGDQPAR